MKKCLIITLLVISCVQMSSAMSSKGPNMLSALRNYKNAIIGLGAVDHSDYSRALEENRELGLRAQYYQGKLAAAGVADFDPINDTPEGYVSKLSPAQVDAIDKRMQ